MTLRKSTCTPDEQKQIEKAAQENGEKKAEQFELQVSKK
jgi:hypothetical protein